MFTFLVAGRAVSHEIFDFPEMLTKQGLELVQTAVLKPGDAVFIPIGYFYTIASALQYDDGTVLGLVGGTQGGHIQKPEIPWDIQYYT